MLLLSPQDVLDRGIQFVSSNYHHKQTKKTLLFKFKQHYGSSPVDLAKQWHDIQTYKLPEPNHKNCPKMVDTWVEVDEREKSERAFKMFMVTHFFLWTYAKNSELISSRFGICERYCRGKPLWKWIVRISALKKYKIYFPNSIEDPNMELFAYTIDGEDCETREIPHPLFNIDTTACSHKKCGGKF